MPAVENKFMNIFLLLDLWHRLYGELQRGQIIRGLQMKDWILKIGHFFIVDLNYPKKL